MKYNGFNASIFITVIVIAALLTLIGIMLVRL